MREQTQIQIEAYQELRLSLTETPDDSGNVSRFDVQISDPDGRGAVTRAQSVPKDLMQQLRLLEKRKLSVEGIEDLGRVLAWMLFPSEVRAILNSSVYGHSQRRTRLRLQMSPALASFPWEYVFIDELDGFLALRPDISIVRDEMVPEPREFDTTPGPRRMLVALASPDDSGYATLDLERDKNNLQEALGEVEGLRLDFLERASFAEFADRLQIGPDIVHFAGHGDFLGRGGASGGQLIFVDDMNKPVRVTAEDFAGQLRSRNVQLVVLGACHSGRRDPVNPWSSVAASLMKKGIPAAITMQYKISDESMIEFSKSFYTALARGLPLDWAVVEGRLAIKNHWTVCRDEEMRQVGWRDWGVPVFYQRVRTRSERETGQEFVLPVNLNSVPSLDAEDAVATMLVDARHIPEARHAADIAEESLKNNCKQIKCMKEYKDAHDLLQELEGHYRSLHNEVYHGDRLLPEGQLRWRSIKTAVRQICDKIYEVREHVSGSSFTSDAAEWVGSLGEASQILKVALERKNLAMTDEAAEIISDVLIHQLPEMNTRMITHVNALTLDELTPLLTNVCRIVERQIQGPTSGSLGKFAEAVTELDDQAEYLALLKKEHDQLQRLDGRLHVEEMRLFSSLDRFRTRWDSKLKPELRDWCRPAARDWQMELVEQLAEVEQMLRDDDTIAVAEEFQECMRIVSSHFGRVDIRLKKLCAALEKKGILLEAALEKIV